MVSLYEIEIISLRLCFGSIKPRGFLSHSSLTSVVLKLLVANLAHAFGIDHSTCMFTVGGHFGSTPKIVAPAAHSPSVMTSLRVGAVCVLRLSIVLFLNSHRRHVAIFYKSSVT